MASNIAWLSSAIILLIGTEGGEYGLDSANYSTSPLGPANVEILRQSSWRCRDIRPELGGDFSALRPARGPESLRDGL